MSVCRTHETLVPFKLVPSLFEDLIYCLTGEKVPKHLISLGASDLIIPYVTFSDEDDCRLIDAWHDLYCEFYAEENAFEESGNLKFDINGIGEVIAIKVDDLKIIKISSQLNDFVFAMIKAEDENSYLAKLIYQIDSLEDKILNTKFEELGKMLCSKYFSEVSS